ncbi:MAG: hypothetical protein M1828_007653 [Chrysothrix sp. TS-e1954]|nr:MAG: hypothetical protein M1828_007653 [Chrysothrix sp. TS-e1954]
MSRPWLSIARSPCKLTRPPLRSRRRWFPLASYATTSSPPTQAPTISSTLLTRARLSATEHARLTTELSTSYSPSLAKRAGTLSHITSALSTYESAQTTHKELTSLSTSPDLELRSLALEDLPSALTALTAATADLTTSLLPPHPFAHLPCLLEIRPGAGGSEAALFAGDLLRMYTSLCARLAYSASLLKYEDTAGSSDPHGSDAPLSEAILEVPARGSYGLLRLEAGVHRVQRVPATESKGRTHTSAVNVLVLPSLPSSSSSSSASEEAGHQDSETDPNDPNSDYYVSSADVRIDVMRARGAGGQHVNTTDSAVRLTHLPTNTVVACQDSRSQHQNRAKAWQILRSRLAALKREAREEEVERVRQGTVGHGKSGRGDKVRTYNWGQSRVTDHRSGVSVGQLGDVMEGGEALGRLMESVRAWDRDREVAALGDA